MPAGYTPPRSFFELVQWLDDDRIVLAGGRRITELSWPDHADLLVCSLSEGECLVEVSACALNSHCARGVRGGQIRSMIVTLAWPPPSHMVCRP